MKKGTKTLLTIIVVGLVLFGAIQLIPYGHNHTNPAVVATPKWDSPQTEQLIRTTCYDCHSNETVWPWYSNIAPASWLLQRDVDEGRVMLNFSTWPSSTAAQQGIVDEITRVVQSGRMPPSQYLIIHTAAKLTDAQKQQLIQGLQNSIK